MWKVYLDGFIWFFTSISALVVMMMGLSSMSSFMELLLFIFSFWFWFGFTYNSESFFFQLIDFFFSEVSLFWGRWYVRSASIFFNFLLLVLWSVFLLFSWFILSPFAFSSGFVFSWGIRFAGSVACACVFSVFFSLLILFFILGWIFDFCWFLLYDFWGDFDWFLGCHWCFSLGWHLFFFFGLFNFLGFFDFWLDFFFTNFFDNFLLVDRVLFSYLVPFFFDKLSQSLLHFAIIGEFFEGIGDCFNILIEEGIGFIVLFKNVPELGKFGVFGLGSRMVNGKSSCKVLKFFELLISIKVFIFSDGLFEKGNVLFDFGSFFDQCFFSIDFFYLLWLQVLLFL